jgi:KipI family sensor histidine kinase inhibitor
MQDAEKQRHPKPRPGTRQTTPAPEACPWRWVSERGLRLQAGAETLARYDAIVAAALAEVEAVIPADGSLLVVLHRGAAPSVQLRHLLSVAVPARAEAAGTLHTLPVRYGGKAGLDWSQLAERAGLSVDAAAALHASVEYRVMFIGFQPGFAYLHGTPASLQYPRLDRPRTQVAAGSLAIGGVYSGIYPASGPGGWNLIGEVEVSLFDATRERPALLQPGDRVRLLVQ